MRLFRSILLSDHHSQKACFIIIRYCGLFTIKLSKISLSFWKVNYFDSMMSEVIITISTVCIRVILFIQQVQLFYSISVMLIC